MAEQLITFEYEDHEGQNQTFDMYVQDIGDIYESHTPSEDPPTEPFEMSTTILRLSSTHTSDPRRANPYCCWFKPGESETYLYGPTPIHSSWYPTDEVGWSNIANPNWKKVKGFQNKLEALAAYMLSSGASDRDPNIIKLTDPTDRSKMFYDGDEMGETIPTQTNRWTGQLMYYKNDDDERQTARFSWYIRNDSPPGADPVYTVYFGGPHTFTAYGMTRTNESITIFNENDPPALGFWRVPLKCDIDEPYPTDPSYSTGWSGGDGEHYGETINVIVMIYRSNGNVTVGIVPEFIFHKIDAPQDTETSPEGTNVTPSGWVGSWDFSSDSDTPTMPTGLNFVNQWEHGIRLYRMNNNQMKLFMDAMWDLNLDRAIHKKMQEFFGGANTDWLRGIITLHNLPFELPGGDDGAITIFGQMTPAGGTLMDFETDEFNGQHVKRLQSKPLKIPATYGDFVFLDWDSCSAYIRLPFIGKVAIDVKKFRGGYLYVNYFIDILTGNCLAQVYATSMKIPGVEETGKQILIYEGTGNCAIHIPYCGNTEGAFKQLQAIAGIGMSAIGAVGGSAGLSVASGLASTLTSPISNSEEHSYVASEASALMDPHVKLVIEGPYPNIAKTQREDLGFAAWCSDIIRNFVTYEGRKNPREFLQGQVHAYVPNCSDEERAEIERLFAGGVIV